MSDEPRVASPIVANNTAEPSQPVKISIEPDIDAPAVSNEEDPSDPNSGAEKQELIPQDDWHTSPMFYEIANFLGVDSKDYEGAADQISTITDWAIEEANSNKIEDIMSTIRGLEDKLQPPPWGERRYSNIYRALRMEARYKASKQALGAFTKTGKWAD